MSKQTANALNNALIETLNSGTGVGAKPSVGEAGGKTATAETGWIENGREILHGLFCGFFSWNGTTYVITVFSEDVSSGYSDCAPIFKKVAEQIAAINNI